MTNPFWCRIPHRLLSARLSARSPIRASVSSLRFFPGIDVDRHQFAESVILVGVEGRAAVGVESDACDLVEHHPVEVGQRRDLARAHVHPPEETDPARVAEGGDEAVGLVVDKAARHRSEPARAEVANFGQRIFADLGEIGRLEAMLERDPVIPDVVERSPEHMFELACVKGLGVLRPAEPFDRLLGAVGQRQIIEETSPVEVGICADLEVGGSAFAFEPEGREEARVVADLGPEHHLVIGALGTAKAARHPGFEEHRTAFHVPARGQVSRACQEVVEDQFRVLLEWRRLAAQEPAPERVLLVPHVDHADVRQLVVGQRVEALAGREGLHRQRQGRDVEQHHVARAAKRRRIAVIGEILEQHRCPVPRLPAQGLLVEGKRIFERPREIGRQIGLHRVEVEQRQVAGLERRKLEPRGVLGNAFRTRLLGRVGLGRVRLDRLPGRRIRGRRGGRIRVLDDSRGVGRRRRRRLVGLRLGQRRVWGRERQRKCR